MFRLLIFYVLPLEWVEGGPACLAKFLRAAANDRPPGDGGGGAWPIRFGIKVRLEPELVGWGLTKPKNKNLFIYIKNNCTTINDNS